MGEIKKKKDKKTAPGLVNSEVSITEKSKSAFTEDKWR